MKNLDPLYKKTLFFLGFLGLLGGSLGIISSLLGKVNREEFHGLLFDSPLSNFESVTISDRGLGDAARKITFSEPHEVTELIASLRESHQVSLNHLEFKQRFSLEIHLSGGRRIRLRIGVGEDAPSRKAVFIGPGGAAYISESLWRILKAKALIENDSLFL